MPKKLKSLPLFPDPEPVVPPEPKTKLAAPKGKGSFVMPGALLEKYELVDKGGYITQEFQDFGYRLALDLNDKEHLSLYMRLSKNTNRLLLENALSFVLDAASAKNKAALFMWKLKQLKAAAKAKASSATK